MSVTEIVLVGLLCLMIGGVLWSVYRSPDQTLFWSPLTLFAAIFAYYFVIGPLISLGLDNTFAYGMDLRDVMWKSWLAGVLGLGSIYLGFCISVRFRRPRLTAGLTAPARRRLTLCGGVLAFAGFAGFIYNAYTSGQSLVDVLLPFHQGGNLDGVEREGLATGNYIFLAVNTFIPAICLLVALTAEMPLRRRLWVVGLPLAFVVLFYMSLTFRHRIVILLMAVAATHGLLRRRRPNPGTLVAGAAGIVLLAGLIVLTRVYGRGLDLRQLSELSLTDIFLGGFGDSGTFFTLALVIGSFPSIFPYIGLDPLWVALTIPVPRALWPNKPYSSFLQYFEYLTGTQGQAVPVPGEHYMMAGWAGIIVGGIVIGMLYRGFWDFYRANPRNPFVIAFYAVAWGLCFPVINRGYLAQTLMEFFFDLMPLVACYYVTKKLLLSAAAPVASAPRPSSRLASVLAAKANP